MIRAKTDYNTRLQEIEKFFNFLIVLDNNNCHVTYSDAFGDDQTTQIDTDLLKIMKANGFLLLYNLIESTVLKSIQAIFDNITDMQLTFHQLSENLKTLWINHKGRSLKGVDDINVNKVRNIMREVANSIVANEIANLETSCINISGNIDAREIRSIANKFGFDDTNTCEHLLTIKTKRNHLAHGDFSFSEIGRDFSVPQLLILKDESLVYLNDVMNNIEQYINIKKFKHSA